MTKQEQIYRRITSALEKDPDLSVVQYAKKHNLNLGAYYRERKKQAVPARATRQAAVREAKTRGNQLVLVMGSPSQIREFVGGL